MLIFSLFGLAQNLSTAEVATKLNECLVRSYREFELEIIKGETTVELVYQHCEKKLQGQAQIVSFKGSDLHFTYEVQITSYTGTNTLFGMGGWGPEIKSPPLSYSHNYANPSQVRYENLQKSLEEKEVAKVLSTLGPMASSEQIAAARAQALQNAQSQTPPPQHSGGSDPSPASTDWESRCSFGPLPPECSQYQK